MLFVFLFLLTPWPFHIYAGMHFSLFSGVFSPVFHLGIVLKCPQIKGVGGLQEKKNVPVCGTDRGMSIPCCILACVSPENTCGTLSTLKMSPGSSFIPLIESFLLFVDNFLGFSPWLEGSAQSNPPVTESFPYFPLLEHLE